MREVKNSRRRQSVSNRKNSEQTTSRKETPKCINNNDGEINASDTHITVHRQVILLLFVESGTRKLR